jgi:hypothetical protein
MPLPLPTAAVVGKDGEAVVLGVDGYSDFNAFGERAVVTHRQVRLMKRYR